MIEGGSVTIYVSDMERAIGFYTGTLGLRLMYRGGPGYAAVGFPVPPAVCVATEPFRLAMEPFRGRIEAVLRDFGAADAAGAAEAIAGLLAHLCLPGSVAAGLRAALPRLAEGGAALAVRS